MWDFFAFPVWGEDVQASISSELRTALQEWSDEWTEVNAGNDGRGWVPPSDEVVNEWRRRGRVLSARLADELGPDYEVGLFDDIKGEVDWSAGERS